MNLVASNSERNLLQNYVSIMWASTGLFESSSSGRPLLMIKLDNSSKDRQNHRELHLNFFFFNHPKAKMMVLHIFNNLCITCSWRERCKHNQFDEDKEEDVQKDGPRLRTCERTKTEVQ